MDVFPDFGAVGGAAQLREIVGALLMFALTVSVLMLVVVGWKTVVRHIGAPPTSSRGGTEIFGRGPRGGPALGTPQRSAPRALAR